MAITEIEKLNLLARFAQKEFFSHGSKVSHAKLGRFILIAFLLHVSVVAFELIAPLNFKNPPTPPPIKVKYVDVQTSVPLKKKETLVDSLKSKTNPKKKIKPLKSSASAKRKVLEKKQYPKQKKYRQKKTAVPKTHNPPSIIQQSKIRVKKRKREKTQQKAPPLPSAFMGAQETLSMLDGLNPEKYASQDPQVETTEAPSNDEPIPLDTKEEKYVSYFSRIKQQIQRVWVYPAQGAKRKLSGEVTLKFEISRDGNLLSLRLVNTSGFDVLDINATKAVKEAAPYYPFPATISKKKLSILATFIYSAN
ncbi:MAG: TonB family protein [Nitrospinales bacterium]|nr:TonB family protein [Nitrospinales bacterium]